MWLLRLFVLVYGAQLLHLVVKAYLYIAPLYLDSVSTVSPYCLKVKIVSQKVVFFFQLKFALVCFSTRTPSIFKVKCGHQPFP